MPGKTLNKLHYRDFFRDRHIILMPVIVKGNGITVIFINTRGCNDRAPQIASDILDRVPRRKVSRFCVYIKAVFMVSVNGGFYRLKGRPDFPFKLVEQDCLEGVPHKFVREEIFLSPFHAVGNAAFGNKTMDMGVPFKVAPKCMQDTDNTWSEMPGFIVFVKHVEDNIPYGMEKAVKKGAVFKEEMPELFRNRENAMPVSGVNDLKRHGSSTLDIIFVPTGGTEAAFAAERDDLDLVAFTACVDGMSFAPVAAVNHFFNVFNDRPAWMLYIDHFFKMVAKNFL